MGKKLDNEKLESTVDVSVEYSVDDFILLLGDVSPMLIKAAFRFNRVSVATKENGVKMINDFCKRKVFK